MKICSRLFFAAIALIFVFVSLDAEAARKESVKPGKGGGGSAASSGAGKCNAGKEKQSDCMCKEDFVTNVTRAYQGVGGQSGRMCLKGVSSRVQQACNKTATPGPGGWTTSAKDAGGCLSDLKYLEKKIDENNAGSWPKEEDLPIGTIFVYEGGGTPHGHIEVWTGKPGDDVAKALDADSAKAAPKATRKKRGGSSKAAAPGSGKLGEGPAEARGWCSDYCSPNHVKAPMFRLKAYYLPPMPKDPADKEKFKKLSGNSKDNNCDPYTGI